MDERVFYVYKHTRSDTGDVFYIGKGKGNRAYDKDRRKRVWKNIVKKTGYTVEIVKADLTEDEAFKLEEVLVDYFMSQGLCKANLRFGGGSSASFTDEVKKQISNSLKNYFKDHSVWNKGSVGVMVAWNKGLTDHLSEESKASISSTLKEGFASGRIHHWRETDKRYIPSGMKGKKRKREWNVQIVATRGCRPFQAIDSVTGIVVWEGLLQTDCAQEIGLDNAQRRKIVEVLKGRRNRVEEFTFKYLSAERASEVYASFIKYAESLTDADLDAMEASTMEIQRV